MLYAVSLSELGTRVVVRQCRQRVESGRYLVSSLARYLVARARAPSAPAE